MKAIAIGCTGVALACWVGVGWLSGFNRQWLLDSFFGSGLLSIIAWMAHATLTNDKAGRR